MSVPGSGMKELLQGLSIVMIAKNAAGYLEESLSSLSGVADEIVFVDTGSTDVTTEIARKHGCRMYRFEWLDDFSRAKNFGIEQARYRWIMSVDSDEVLDRNEAVAIITKALTDESVPAFIVYQDNLTDSGEIQQHMALRLFRNDPRIRFTNPVHECISERLFFHWQGFFPPVLDIHLKHYGYLAKNSKGKLERNIALLQSWLNCEPDNIIANYKLGSTLCAVGQKEESLKYLEIAFRHFDAGIDRYTLRLLPVFAVNYHSSLISAGKLEKAKVFEQMMMVL